MYVFGLRWWGGGVGGEWVGGVCQGLDRWCYVCGCCESGLPVYLRILGALNPVTPYGYLRPNLYLFMVDTQTQIYLCVFVGPVFISTSHAFMRSSASHPVGPHAQETVNRTHISGGGRFRHNLHISLYPL